MNYSEVYNQLINTRRNRILPPDVYTEIHHIIPRCMGGNDDTDNLVKLTAREHYIAHRLLYLIYRKPKLAHAWFFMCSAADNLGDRVEYSSKHYERARIAHSNAMKMNTGTKNHFYGKKHTQKTKDKMISSRNKTYDNNPELYAHIINEQKIRMSKAHKGVPKSKTHKERIGKKSKNKMILRNIITGVSISLYVWDKNLYSKHIWINNYSYVRKFKNSEVVSCPYCNKKGDNNNASFKKWHFNNCKLSPNYVKIPASKRVYKKFWSPWFESKCNDAAIDVYSKLFKIEQLLNENSHLGSKSIMLLLMHTFKFNESHRYYVRNCRTNIIAGKFNYESKHNLLLTLGITDESI